MLYDLVIIGAGPAGITAAIYAARKGLKFVIVSPEVGGQLLKTSIVENYTGYQKISGTDLTQKFEEHFAEFDFDFHRENITGIEKKSESFLVKADEETFETKSIIVATGSEPRHLNVPGENKLRAKGVTYCTTCDGPLFKGRDVVVVGGGNSALESILQLSNIGKKVYVVNINAEFTGSEILVEKVEKLKNVEIFYQAETLEILGENIVEGLKIKTAGGERTLKVQGVFINIGYLPQSDLVKDLVKITDYGEIEVNAKGETNLPGIFAAGDCTNIAYKQIVTATGAGSTAALSVFGYISRLK